MMNALEKESDSLVLLYVYVKLVDEIGDRAFNGCPAFLNVVTRVLNE